MGGREFVRISRSRGFSFTATFGKLCRRLRKAPLTAEHFLSWRIFPRNSKKSFFGYRARDGRIPWLSVGHRFCAREPLACLFYFGWSVCGVGKYREQARGLHGPPPGPYPRRA